jgi:acyl-CoA synthetase (AMP-forming)/AMP-acid ligase II
MPSRPLLSWLDDPAADRGIRFAEPGGAWQFRPFTDLAGRCLSAAGALAALGVRRGDRVLVVSAGGPDFVAVFYAVLVTGATASVAPPPMSMQGAGYDAHLAAVVTALRPAIVVADADLCARVRGASGDSVRVCSPDDLDGDAGAPARDPAEIALIQFTSGSGGRPRGVRIPADSLAANAAAIRTWLRAGPADEWSSWLPMHHDMGLVGCLITPMSGGNGLWLGKPTDFVRDPMPYLRSFGAGTATITATPGFGLQRLLAKVGPADLAGLDFSNWHAVVVGAERIDPRLLHRFADLLAPYGLLRTAIVPAYGMAEATLAVTGVPLDRGWVEHPMPAPADGGPAPLPDGPRGQVLGCGMPIGDTVVRVADAHGGELADGLVGEIEVRGASLGAGYLDESTATSTLRDGVLVTGDAGFLHRGELYVLGRLGDSVKVRGRPVFAEDVELTVRGAGITGRVAVVLGEHRGRAVAVAVMEGPGRHNTERVTALLRAAAGGAHPVVVSVAAGTIPRTPSGKTRRRELWRRVAADHLDEQEGSTPDGTERAGSPRDGSRDHHAARARTG